MDEEPPPTNMQISFCMDIKTQGAREGLLISTGVFSAAVGNQNEAHSVGSFWPILPATYRIPSSKSIENIASGKVPDSLANGKLERIDLDEFADANISQKELPAGNTNFCENFEDLYQMNLRNNNLQGIQQPSESAIQLNLFEGNHQQLVPLQQRPPSRNGLLTQFVDGCNPPPMRPQNPSPNPNSTTPSSILRDSTTTTTTLEIFRPKADSADFFQLPKGPLAFEKDPVLIVPAKGPVHERRESSETRFGGKIHQQMDPIGAMAQPQQKSVQWGDSISIHPSPTPSSSTAPSQVTVLQSPQQRQIPQMPLLFSPPQHSSTPIQTTNGQFPQMAQSQPIHPMAQSTPTPPPIILSPQSPPPLFDDHLTIFRQQQQKHSERVQRIPPNVAECPPRPPKGRLYGANKRMGAAALTGGENAIPPRPPKPEYLKKRTIRERSQSADPMESDETRNRQFGSQKAQQPQQQQRGGIGPVRSASSNEIFKLYQTRDCLGRVVCEW